MIGLIQGGTFCSYFIGGEMRGWCGQIYKVGLTTQTEKACVSCDWKFTLDP